MSVEMYEKAAEKYKPDKIKTLFIAESPPFAEEGKEPRYFYFEDVKGRDYLFRSIMEVLFPEEYKDFKKSDKRANKKKVPLLKKFKDAGFFLIDACDEPVNQHRNRDFFIGKNFQRLVKKIKGLIHKDAKIILIKKNIFDLLFKELKERGFNVINTKHLDFPSSGNQKKFKEKLKRLLALQRKLLNSSPEIRTKPELSRQTMQAIEKARERMKKGKFLSEAEMKKRLL